MNILYIQPWDFSDLEQISRYQKGLLKKIALPRVMSEVAYLASKEAKIKLLDLNLEILEQPTKKLKDILSEKLLYTNYDAIFISFPAVALGNLIHSIITDCKEFCQNTKIVIGGGAMPLIQETIFDWPVDIAYEGNGFEIPKIIKNLNNSEKLKEIPGVWLKDQKPIIPASKEIINNYEPADLYNARGTFDFNNHLERYQKLKLEPVGLIELTRGCTHKCKFCAIGKQKYATSRNPLTVIKEIEFLLKQGINTFYIIDPTFNLDQVNTSVLLQKLKNLKAKNPKLSILAGNVQGHLAVFPSLI